MEKPRKNDEKDFYTLEEDSPELNKMIGWNACHDAMSTWLEGEVPTEKDIEKVIYDNQGNAYISEQQKNLAQAIHALITRKLTGK